MRILFYQLGLNPLEGGVQRVSWTVAQLLIKCGYEIYCAYYCQPLSIISNSPYKDVVCLSSPNQDSVLSQYISDNGIDVVINQCGSDVNRTIQLARIKEKIPFRLYSFVHISPTGSRDVLGYRDWRIPKIVIRSILKEILIKLYPYDRSAYRKIYELSDKVVLLSKRSIPELLGLIGRSYNDEKLLAIPNPATYCAQSINIMANKQKKILVVSRMGDASKRLLRVLDAWKLMQDILTEWSLIFVGDGTDLPTYRRIAEKDGLKRIKFHGTQVPDSYYEESSIFLMTSATEGFGMTLIEAQQFGCVPVAMDTYSALHDIIEDGVNGVITPSGDINTFANVCISLASDSEKLNLIGINAMQSSNRFLSSNIVTQWRSLLEQ